MTYILLLIIISTILSYLILKFIYRIIFKSTKSVSKFLVFLGSIGLIIFYYTPYSYYLEPSFYKFKEICKLDPEIYQANGSKLDEEYYNKVLRYFDTDLDNMSKSYKKELGVTNDKKYSRYWFETWIDGRTEISFEIWFKSNIAIKDNIDFSIKPFFYANWDKMRPLPAGNEGTGFFLGSVPISCIYFKKD